MGIERYDTNRLIAGCDEAGRGCLAGPVVAAAVVLPAEFNVGKLRDSKKLSATQRHSLRQRILDESLDFAVHFESPRSIEHHNILWASVLAMQMAVQKLRLRPEHLLIDGHRFRPLEGYSHSCVIGGDDKYACISAASILAKTFRDDYMEGIHPYFPEYQWKSNKGYPTKQHRKAIIEHGICRHHRRNFSPCRATLL